LTKFTICDGVCVFSVNVNVMYQLRTIYVIVAESMSDVFTSRNITEELCEGMLLICVILHT